MLFRSRSQPLRVHRPEIQLGPGPGHEQADTDLWKALDAPLRFAARAPKPPDDAVLEDALWRIERWLAAAEAQVAAARFEEALETAAKARAGLEALPPGRELAPRRLRLELVEATAEAARGRDDEARACFARVLALEPDFALDARSTSPKLMRLLDAARAGAGVSR